VARAEVAAAAAGPQVGAAAFRRALDAAVDRTRVAAEGPVDASVVAGAGALASAPGSGMGCC
jgi:hypothetical protein